MAIKNNVSGDFYPRSSIVKSVFDCHLSVVNTITSHEPFAQGGVFGHWMSVARRRRHCIVDICFKE